MMPILETCFLLAAVLAAVAVAARRLHIPAPILLVLTGLALAFVPGLPEVALSPEMVLLLFLPPLIYTAAVATSWRDFRNDLRTISLLALGGVAFTTCAVAAAAHWLLGMGWPIAFVLGAVVSPPDVVAPIAIASRLGIPRRIVAVLEGEGLVNDASALIIYRFAVAAVVTGAFSLAEAAATFVIVLLGEVVWGMFVGWLTLHLRRWACDPRVELTLSLLTPFLAFWPPETLGGSGVLATVAAGLYVSWNGPLLISSETRLQGFFFWDMIEYLLTGTLFLLTGLQDRAVIAGIVDGSWWALLLAGAAISVVVVLARFAWIYLTIAVSAISPASRRRQSALPWEHPFLIAFTGIRGVVSLAAAFAIPFTLADGQPFPERNMILYLTFCVILVTLVGQGLALPFVIRRLGLADTGRDEREEERLRALAVRIDGARDTLTRLETCDESDEIVSPLRIAAEHRAQHLAQARDEDGESGAIARRRAEIERDLIALERRRLFELRRRDEVSDEARRQIERELDLQEVQLIGNLRQLGE